MNEKWYAGILRLTWRNIFYWVVISALCFAITQTGSKFTELDQTETRQVRLIGAWSYLSGNKTSVSEHWKGTFIEVATGKQFEYELHGSLYRSFIKDDRPIDLTLELKPDYWDPDRAGVAVGYQLATYALMILALYAIFRWLVYPDEKIYPDDKWFCL